jgi:hypothetical protein
MPINQAAMFALLEAEDGPVGLYLKEITENVADIARENAAFIMHRYPQATDSVSFEMQGTTGIVGIGPGRIEEYLANKEVRERNWLVPALEYKFAVLNGEASNSQV